MPALDFWVLAAVGGDLPAAAKGTYMAAVNAARIPGFLANALTAVLVPSIAAALAAGQRDIARRTLQGATRFMLVVLVGLCTAVAVNATEIMQLLFSGGICGRRAGAGHSGLRPGPVHDGAADLVQRALRRRPPRRGGDPGPVAAPGAGWC